MNRTHDIFVDNGLFVLANILKKDIDKISKSDIIDNVDNIVKILNTFISCEKYKKISIMAFWNSALAHPSTLNDKDKREIKIKEQFQTLIDNIGDDEVCYICGEKHVKSNISKEYTKMLSRSLYPLLCGNTFINYTNNLKMINICPICIMLGMISLLNMRKAGNLLLYISDDNDFMYDYTDKIQQENIRTILNPVDDEKDESYLKQIFNNIEWLINKERIYDGYIKVLFFNNSGQSQIFKNYLIPKNSIQLIRKLQNKKLLSEFKSLNLTNLIIDNRLSDLYLSYTIDKEKQQLKCSQDLFKILDMEVSKLDTKTLEIIKKVCNKVKDLKQKDEISSLQNISKISDFESLLIKWQQNYSEQTGNQLFDSLEEYDKLCNIKEHNGIKHRMIMQFMLN